MESESPLVNIFLDNKEKILKAEKYTDKEFKDLIQNLSKAEEERYKVLKKIEEMH